MHFLIPVSLSRSLSSDAFHLSEPKHEADLGWSGVSVCADVCSGLLWSVLPVFCWPVQPATQTCLCPGTAVTGWRVYIYVFMFQWVQCLLRVFQHSTRVFHALDGSVERSDSGLWINSLDYSGMQHITPLIPQINDSIRSSCSEQLPYCGFPWFLPVKSLVKWVTDITAALCVLQTISEPQLPLITGRTGIFLLLQSLLKLRWSSCSYPDRRTSGEVLEWASRPKVRVQGISSWEEESSSNIITVDNSILQFFTSLNWF